jgi:hypothetical protein
MEVRHVREAQLGCGASPADADGDGDVARARGSQDQSGEEVQKAARGGDSGHADSEQLLARKRRERDEAIDRLAASGLERGSTVDRSFWAMVYDFEHAPTTTNLKQLNEIGVQVPPSGSLADDELVIQLWEVIRGLGRLHVYLTNTNHLTDRQLYERLESEVLVEEIRDVAAADGVQEWIDMATMEETETFDKYYNDFGPNRAIPPSNRDDRLPRPPGHL